MSELLPQDSILKKIYYLRGQKVMLDEDLAELYGVPTKRLNEQVKRNLKRFPSDFMFQLNNQEVTFLRSQVATLENGQIDSLRSQFATSNRGGRRTLPYVFTEHGVAMLSSVLNSDRAIQVNIEIMRAFTQLRQFLLSHKELAQRIDELEVKYDEKFRIIFNAIRELIEPKVKNKKRIGFL